MPRVLVTLAAIAACAGIFGHSRVTGQGAPASLWLDAVAFDRHGAPVMDLTPAEIEVWIAGYRIPLLDVSAVTPAVRGPTVALVLDNASINPVQATRVREAAHRFIDLLEDGDRLAIVLLHGGRMALTGDRAELRRAVDAYRPQGLPFRVEDAGRDVLRTVAAVSNQLAEHGTGRTAIVAIGAGWLLDTPLPPPGLRDLRAEWVAAMRAAARAHAGLYVVDPAGLDMVPGRPGGASGFARETGGHAFLNTNDLRAAAARIWQEAGHYYLLGVADPPMQRTAELRELDVRVLRPGVTMRARRALAGASH